MPTYRLPLSDLTIEVSFDNITTANDPNVDPRPALIITSITILDNFGQPLTAPLTSGRLFSAIADSIHHSTLQ